MMHDVQCGSGDFRDPRLSTAGRRPSIPAGVCHDQRSTPLWLSSPDSDYDLRGVHVLPLRGSGRTEDGPGDDHRSPASTTAWRSTL